MLAVAAIATVDDRPVVEPEPREPEPPPEPPPTLRSITLPDVPNRELIRASLRESLDRWGISTVFDVAPKDRRSLADASAKRARKAARNVESARRSAKV